MGFNDDDLLNVSKSVRSDRYFPFTDLKLSTNTGLGFAEGWDDAKDIISNKAKNNSAGDTQLGRMYLRNGNFDESHKCFNKAGNDPANTASYEVANMLRSVIAPLLRWEVYYNNSFDTIQIKQQDFDFVSEDGSGIRKPWDSVKVTNGRPVYRDVYENKLAEVNSAAVNSSPIYPADWMFLRLGGL